MELGSPLIGSLVPFVEFGSLLWSLAPLMLWGEELRATELRATELQQSASSSSSSCSAVDVLQPQTTLLAIADRPWQRARPAPKRKLKPPPKPRGSVAVENAALGVAPVYVEDEDQSDDDDEYIVFEMPKKHENVYVAEVEAPNVEDPFSDAIEVIRSDGQNEDVYKLYHDLKKKEKITASMTVFLNALRKNGRRHLTNFQAKRRYI